MAARFDAAADGLGRTTQLPAIPLTMMAWVYPTTISGTMQPAMAIGAADTVFYSIGTGVSSGNKVALNGGSGTGATYGTTTLTAATWIHLAMVASATGANGIKAYLNGVQEISMTCTSITINKMYVGNNDFGQFLNGRVAALKVYGAALTADEIVTEMRQIMPFRMANINTWTPLFRHTELADMSQNKSAVWVAGGTLTTEDGPPVAWNLAMSQWRGTFTTVTPPAGTILPHMMQHMGA